MGPDRYVTTSLGTMIAAGSPTYGPSKAALEALSAIMAKDLDGTGVTINVLVLGGITNTPMISDEAGFARVTMIQLQVMAPPLVRLASDAAGNVTGRRFLAIDWDPALAPERAAEKADALGRQDQHRDDADRAEPLLGRSESLYQLERCRTTSGLSSGASAWVSLTPG
jgi:short chain dehydrogenase